MDEVLLHKTAKLQSVEEKDIRRQCLELQGLDCSDCALVVEHRLSRLEGVLDVQVDFTAQAVNVAYDRRRIQARTIKWRIQQLGYAPVPTTLESWWQNNQELLLSLGAGALTLVAWLGETWLNFPGAASLGLYLSAYLLGGLHTARHALQALRQGHFDSDVLMLAAALGAASLGEFAEGALLLFLFSLGHALEERALDRARQAVRALGALIPRKALVVRDGQEQVVRVEQLALGDEVLVRPGERLPVDGQVLGGHSAVDQSPITGESLPVEKAPGEAVFAGSVNGPGALRVRVTRLAKDSTLARVMQLVEQAQAHKAPTQQKVESFMRRFVPVVLAATILLVILPPFLGVPLREAFRRAMILLVATSPCALALGTPAAVLAGIAQAARNGVLVKGGVHLENLGRLEALAFDKTATLTSGELRVSKVVALDGGEEDQVLALAAAVERQSGHPLSQAVLRAAEEAGLRLPEASQVRAETGLGVQAQVDGQAARVGSLKWFDELALPVGQAARQLAAEMQAQGQSVMLVAVGQQVLGLVAVADTLRPGVAEALHALRKLGVRRMVMLSGDNAGAAALIARQAGLVEFRAGLLPEDKLAAIDELQGSHAVVGMVGDGVNDAPALGRATVGIAMGGAATEVALETADVALMGAELGKLPFAVSLGRATQGVIRQNLVIALGVMAVLAGLALSGLAGIGLAVVLHEGSTLLVVANALRLLHKAG
ncbi:MAG: cation-translocating P-type ATPase [Chloroflexota bacterium]